MVARPGDEILQRALVLVRIASWVRRIAGAFPFRETEPLRKR
jgi:hypothetical protein